MKKKSKKRRLLMVLAIVSAVCVLACTIAAIYLVRYSTEQNKTILVTEYTVSHPDIPAAFEGKKIVHLTDLHSKDFGTQLTDRVKEAEPDIIVITGDWIGYVDTDITVAKRQVEEIAAIAPVYYVGGNHEILSVFWGELFEHMAACGVTLMSSDSLLWEEGGEVVQIIGAHDTEFGMSLWGNAKALPIEEMYSILLFHRPEYFEEAVDCGVDLMLSGHTHGGQIRLPWIGTVYVPDQGLFPKYDAGRFEHDGSTLIVSQGLGESVYMRILCPPEMVVITLDAA